MRLGFYLLLIISFLSVSIDAQNINPQVQKKINEYIKFAQQNKAKGNNNIAASYYLKVGNMYRQYNSVDKAIEAYSNALDLLKNSANYTAKSQINTYLAFLYRQKRNLAQSEKYFVQAYNTLKNYADKNTLASMQYNIGEVQEAQKKYKEAIKSYNNALTMFLELNSWSSLKTVTFKMAKCYKMLGDEANYTKYYNWYVSYEKKIKDEVIKQKEKEAVIEREKAQKNLLQLQIQQYKNKMMSDSVLLMQRIAQQSKAEVELQKIKLMQKDAQIQHQKELEKERKKTIEILAGGLMIIFVALFFIFLLYLSNIKKKNELQKLNKRLKEQNKLIEDSRKELEKKNKQITDSINYASKIQQAILPLVLKIKKSFKDSFIFYRPRDVVSGDFYWYAEIEKYRIIAAIDCTGHSVPGAFMSMIANTLMNEIIKTKKITDLNIILYELNKGVVDTLIKNRPDEAMNDGMDISIFKFEKNSRKAEFIAANHKAIIFVDGNIEILEGDLFSIGGFIEGIEPEFNKIDVDLGKESVIYMFSDGFIDQFNIKNKKYMTNRFIDFVSKIYGKNMDEQERLFSKEFDDWRGEQRQIDDVLVIGLKI
jgi:serine phosphatase RsbU (regulator of sigma subunit)